MTRVLPGSEELRRLKLRAKRSESAVKRTVSGGAGSRGCRVRSEGKLTISKSPSSTTAVTRCSGTANSFVKRSSRSTTVTAPRSSAVPLERALMFRGRMTAKEVFASLYANLPCTTVAWYGTSSTLFSSAVSFVRTISLPANTPSVLPE